MFNKVTLLFVSIWMSGAASAAVVVSTTSTTITSNVGDASSLLFGGEAAGCSKPTNSGDPDCCSVTGWGSDSTLNLCTAAERNLATARNENRAFYVGDTCIQENGSCKAPLSVYCVFPDRVTYIVETEGRRQLGIDFGTAANPNCGGLTQNQVESIDLNKIDFSAAASPFVVLKPAQS